jgi:ABC-2 type transport system ATP-binding protein
MNERHEIIKVEELSKRFGSFVANDKLSFSVYEGEIFGFLGANGAGKTTAMRILCGLSSPSSGKVTVAGYDVAHDAQQIRRRIGYMSQKFSLYTRLSVRENFEFYGGIYGMRMKDIRRRMEELLHPLGMMEYRDRPIHSLPLGWKQKLAFSVALVHQPAIVFLDEPTSGVDPVTRRQFWDMIYHTASEGVTIFLTTHYMDEAEYCERICILAAGRIRAIGSPAEMKENNACLSMDEVFVKLARD